MGNLNFNNNILFTYKIVKQCCTYDFLSVDHSIMIGPLKHIIIVAFSVKNNQIFFLIKIKYSKVLN